MKFENTWTGNWEGAFHGLRHPMESYAKSDSDFGFCEALNDDSEIIIKENNNIFEVVEIGHRDMDLAQRMIKAGTPNDKFLRQIFVSVDITAPLYWWKEMDTYKVGTTANSTSTMHKLASTPITIDCFETDDYIPDLVFEEGIDDHYDNPWHYECIIKDYIGDYEKKVHFSETLIGLLESLRHKYLETKDVRYWKELIRWLPEGWLQTRQWTANYAVLRNIYHWRKDHKLSEWHQFCDWIETLPYANELILFDNK